MFTHGVSSLFPAFLIGLGSCLSLWLSNKARRKLKMGKKGLWAGLG